MTREQSDELAAWLMKNTVLVTGAVIAGTIVYSIGTSTFEIVNDIVRSNFDVNYQQQQANKEAFLKKIADIDAAINNDKEITFYNSMDNGNKITIKPIDIISAEYNGGQMVRDITGKTHVIKNLLTEEEVKLSMPEIASKETMVNSFNDDSKHNILMKKYEAATKAQEITHTENGNKFTGKDNNGKEVTYSMFIPDKAPGS